MKSGLTPGMTTARRLTVDRPRTVDFLGEELRLYATPELIRDIESTCREFLLGFADPGEDSVGTGVSLVHSGGTLLGSPVEINVTVKEVNGRRVQFSVVARDDRQEIGRGEHGRAIVETEKLRARLAALKAS